MATLDYSLPENFEFEKLSDCIAYYQKYHLTKHKYEWRANALKFFDPYPLQSLRKFHAKQYHLLRSSIVSNATINRELSFARAAINCVNRDFELKLHNAFTDIKFTEADFIPSYLNYDDYQKLLSSAKALGYSDLHDYIVLLAMTGCRPHEVLTLSWDNVFLDKRQFIVRNCWSNSKKTLYKYLNDTAIAVLSSRLEKANGLWVFTNPKTNKPIDSYHKCFKKLKAHAGVNCTFYDLRHSYASWLVQGSVPIYTVRDLLGHSDVTTTQRYAHLDFKTYCNALKLIG